MFNNLGVGNSSVAKRPRPRSGIGVEGLCANHHPTAVACVHNLSGERGKVTARPHYNRVGVCCFCGATKGINHRNMYIVCARGFNKQVGPIKRGWIVRGAFINLSVVFICNTPRIGKWIVVALHSNSITVFNGDFPDIVRCFCINRNR